jgi:hypothetical protein
LAVEYMQLLGTKEDTPICYEKNGIRIRLSEYEDTYKMIYEATIPEIDIARFKYCFLRLT